MELLLAALGCLAIGYFVGVTSLGGFLAAPLLLLVADVSYVQAVLITLLTAIPGGLLASVEYGRRRQLDWRLTALLSVSSLPGLAVGLWLSHTVSAAVSQRVLGVFLLAATLLLLLKLLLARQAPGGPMKVRPAGGSRFGRFAFDAALGLLAGIASAMAGVGGALIFAPVLLYRGMEPGKAAGTGVMASACIAVCGTAGHLLHMPFLPPALSIAAVGAASVGMVLGARTAVRVSGAVVGYCITGLCFAAGLYFFAGG